MQNDSEVNTTKEDLETMDMESLFLNSEIGEILENLKNTKAAGNDGSQTNS